MQMVYRWKRFRDGTVAVWKFGLPWDVESVRAEFVNACEWYLHDYFGRESLSEKNKINQ